MGKTTIGDIYNSLIKIAELEEELEQLQLEVQLNEDTSGLTNLKIKELEHLISVLKSYPI